ncbi:APH(3') family aminoglycoside O-phosphotransferase [Sphingomonas xinjiangensis]|uniref:Aminoglycoside 3'-phosphotransferase n=1 Tax=Sphingomonas xinjiangensis TaxID=643568 RepID=A0A840YRI4_9SPHN|nr:APH(3') family aminoglycoside O-phosphotransferase [Sphingomonas xinjiangensis]MBB5712232.1 aminoglycoside 3'-phosphotransferase-1 [Sphingomonas xinjiangensis]
MAGGGPARERPVPPPFVPPSLAALVEGAQCHQDLVGEAGADVYRIARPDGSLAYLKYGTGSVARDIADEMARLRWLDGQVAVPKVRQFLLDGDAAWLVTAALPGRTAFQCLEAEPETAPALVDALAGFLRDLHALPVAACPFNADHALRLMQAEQRLRDGLIDAEDFGDAHSGWSPERLWAKLGAMLPLSTERVVTHGDFSLDNILIEDGRVVGCIDVGRAGIADPYQDLAILWDCLGAFDDALGARLFAAYGADTPDMARLDFHLTLDECF